MSFSAKIFMRMRFTYRFHISMPESNLSLSPRPRFDREARRKEEIAY